MKKLMKIAVLLIIGSIIVVGCKKEEVDTDVPSKRLIFTSEQNQGNQIRVNTSLTFGDVSSGVISRRWQFPEGVTNVGQSEEEIVKAIFNKVGEYDVTLTQTFEESAFVDGVQRGATLDTTIVVTVIEPIEVVLKANLLNEDGTLGEALQVSDNARNTIEASSTVRYSFETIGLPQNIEWTIEGGDPATAEGDSTVDVVYKRQGTFGIEVGANSARPKGNAFTSFTDIVNVIASTDPIVLDGVEGKIDGTLALEFNREMDESSVNIDEFAITIANGGSSIPATIKSISADPMEKNVLIVTLDNETIFINDAVSISYTGGTLFSLDGVASDNFIERTMDSFEQRENILASTGIDFGFEEAIDRTGWNDNMWGGIWADYTFSISTTRAHSGNKSALIEYNKEGAMIVVNKQGKFNLENGKAYEISHWVYIEQLGSSDPNEALPEVRFYTNPGLVDRGIAPSFTDALPTGEWVRSATIFEASSTEEVELLIRGFNQFNPESLIFHIDDLSISEVTLRP